MVTFSVTSPDGEKKIIKSYTIDNYKFKDDFSNITFEMVLIRKIYKR